jgi:hypothetical protein
MELGIGKARHLRGSDAGLQMLSYLVQENEPIRKRLIN